MKPVIFGLSGPVLTPDETAFFRDADPLGYILFGRNCIDRAQMRALTDSLRSLSGRGDLPILIDQEGGRVARMRPPEWPAFPPPAAFAALYARAPSSAIAAAKANAQAIGAMLAEVGVNVDALPLLDVAQGDMTAAIGDRSFGSDAMQVAALGRATLDGLAAAGVLGIVKHMPGHGRARVDSHLELPRVAASADALETDLAPFRTLASAPLAMTAHVVFEAWDAGNPATLSPTVIEHIIRTRIGFDGLLMTDDIDMKALSGTPAQKAAAAIAAGCDVVLDCWARMDEMVAIAAALDSIAPGSRDRLDRAMATLRPADATPFAALVARRDELLALT
ncbi:beta-N-acetylhexosaminidase [Sphingomonas sp. Leaf25]|uniref:beta-N-acetylhexosaminidase n=1 Tax=Sphingomonas sp. Leaf25 TaxID=1735692 RepID=UPI0006FAD7A8|nr:beta-N-acetylhexosaminidase [Sphingomonas sp. Leaf25]KQN06892.1 beta-hexosaminidase [Sphingomonas sp. Leaf25]